MIRTRHFLLILVLALVLGFLAWKTARGEDAFSRPLKVATWNMQWLIAPETALVARIACRERRAAPIPCDVARELARDSADLGRLAQLARRLDADVIAFQEVENAAIARRVFRGYDICIATGSGVQHAGFAVRAGLRHQCQAPLTSLAAGGRGRPGQPLMLFPPHGPAIKLLSVHLKSGCAREPIDSPDAACRLLAAQAQALGDWIAPRARKSAPFMVLGDFNRTPTSGEADEFWSLLDQQAFETAAAHLPFGNCVFGAPYGEFIDHILVGRALLPRVSHAGFQQMRFRTQEATRFLLSDHCPVSVSVFPESAL